MKRKLSIQKSFIFGVTAVAVVAVLTGVVMRMSTISADTVGVSNAESVSDCYQRNAWTVCALKFVDACTRGQSMATKTIATPTDQEKLSFGDKVKAYDIGISNGNSGGKFRLLVAARRTGSSGPVRFDVSLTPKIMNWGGNGDKIYLIFPDGLGYTKTYNLITKNSTWTSYINKDISTGSVNLMFAGKNDDGCLKSVIDIAQALVIPIPSPSPSVSVSPSPSPSPTVSPSPSPSPSPSVSPPPPSPSPTVSPSPSPVPALSLIPAASIDQTTLKQGTKIVFFNDTTLDNGVLARKDSDVAYNWWDQPPNTGLKANDWSSQITSEVMAPTTGGYDIGVNYNDGVRIWLGGRKIIDDWTDWVACPNGPVATCDNANMVKRRAAKVHMEQGKLYPLRIEYYDKTAKAVLKVFWKTPGATSGVIIPKTAFFTTYNPNPAHGTGTGLLGMYYSGSDFNDYVFYRKDATVNFDWKLAAPRKDMAVDNFSVKWNGKIRPRFSEEYTFSVTAKDGAKVWVNNEVVIDQFHDVLQPTTWTGKTTLVAGKVYPIQIEYYNSQGTASMSLKWKSPSEKLAVVPYTDLYFPGAPIVSVVPSKTPSATTSGVPDGSFESGTDGWTAHDATISQSAEQKHAGIHSLKVTNTGNYGSARHSYSTVVGQKYSISAWVFNPNKQTRLWVGSAVNLGDLHRIFPVAGAGWKRISTSFVATGTTTYFEFRPDSTGRSTSYLDEFSLSAAATVSPTPSKTPSKVPSPSPSPSKTIAPSPSPSPSVTPILKITVKPGWNAISIPSTSSPVLATPMTIDPYNFLTFAFNTSTLDTNPNSPTYNKIVRQWNQSPSIFNKRMGYYLKNNSSKDVIATFQNSTSANSAVVYKGWNLLANSSAKAMTLAEMTYTKKTCTDGGGDPINCAGYFGSVPLSGVSFGKVGEGKAAFTKVYYVAKPNANSQTPDPFTIYNVADLGGPSNVSIPAGGIFWLYLFD